MASHAQFTKSVAARSALVKCMEPDVRGLTPEQLSALHVCKHEIAASIYRLYLMLPQDKADPILEKYFANLPEGVD